jgi:hypothetical protein
MNIYFFSGEDLVVSRRSLLLRDFDDDDDTVKLRSFESSFRLVLDSDLSLYFRLEDSSLEVFALRWLSDLKYSNHLYRNIHFYN